MFCSQCGMKLEDNMKFCARCGAKVVASTADPQVEAAEAPAVETPAPVEVAASAAPAPAVAASAAPAPVAETPAPAMDEIPHTEEPASASVPVEPLPITAAAQPLATPVAAAQPIVPPAAEAPAQPIAPATPAAPYAAPAQPYAAPAAAPYVTPAQPAAQPYVAPAPAQPVATPVAPAKPKKKKKKVWLVILLVLLGLFIAFILIAIILVAVFIKPIRNYIQRVQDSGFTEFMVTSEDISEIPSEIRPYLPDDPFGGEGQEEVQPLGPVEDEDIKDLQLAGNISVASVSGAEEMMKYLESVIGRKLTDDEVKRIQNPDIFPDMNKFEMAIKDYDDVENGWAVTFPVASGTDSKLMSLGIHDFEKEGESLGALGIHLTDNEFSFQRQLDDKGEKFAKQIFPDFYSNMKNGQFGIMMNGTFRHGETEDIYSVSGYMQIMIWYDTMKEPYTIMYHYEAQ